MIRLGIRLRLLTSLLRVPMTADPVPPALPRGGWVSIRSGQELSPHSQRTPALPRDFAFLSRLLNEAGSSFFDARSIVFCHSLRVYPGVSREYLYALPPSPYSNALGGVGGL